MRVFVKVVLPKYKHASFSDFNVDGLIQTINMVQQLQADDGEVEDTARKASDTVMAMECLLTAMVADESDWCTAWSKMLQYVMEHKALPGTLRDLGLEVPRQLQYMMDSGLAKVGVKHEPLEQNGDDAARATATVGISEASAKKSNMQRPGHL